MLRKRKEAECDELYYACLLTSMHNQKLHGLTKLRQRIRRDSMAKLSLDAVTLFINGSDHSLEKLVRRHRNVCCVLEIVEVIGSIVI